MVSGAWAPCIGICIIIGGEGRERLPEIIRNKKGR